MQTLTEQGGTGHQVRLGRGSGHCAAPPRIPEMGNDSICVGELRRLLQDQLNSSVRTRMKGQSGGVWITGRTSRARRWCSVHVKTLRGIYRCLGGGSAALTDRWVMSAGRDRTPWLAGSSVGPGEPLSLRLQKRKDPTRLHGDAVLLCSKVFCPFLWNHGSFFSAAQSRSQRRLLCEPVQKRKLTPPLACLVFIRKTRVPPSSLCEV